MNQWNASDYNGDMSGHIRNFLSMTMSYSGNTCSSWGIILAVWGLWFPRLGLSSRGTITSHTEICSRAHRTIAVATDTDTPARSQAMKSASMTSPQDSCTPASAASRLSTLLRRSIQTSVRMPTAMVILWIMWIRMESTLKVWMIKELFGCNESLNVELKSYPSKQKGLKEEIRMPKIW